jgi:hypothetical protein
MAQYAIDLTWVEAALLVPEWTEADPRPDILRAFRRIPERAGRVLRVAYRRDGPDFVVLSVHFDRKARP